MRFIIIFLIFSFYTLDLFGISYPIHAFKSYSDPTIESMEIIGQVTYKSHRMSESRQRLLDYDTREMILTARLYESESLRLGDTVYIIKKEPDHRKYKNGYIMGEAQIYSIFKTEFQGWMMKASGNLSMVKNGYFIARKSLGNIRNEAWVLYKEGETLEALNDEAGAFVKYRESLNKDPERPETYIRLAILGEKQERVIQAKEYIQKAWNLLSKFKDANDVLRLPGLYLKWNENEESVKSDKELLKHKLKLLSEIRYYKTKLEWFRESFDIEILSMLEKKGIPDRMFQYHFAKLMEDIYHILNNNNLNKVLTWLSKEERDILYEPIYMPYRDEKYSYPKTSWDEAFFDASLYHYQIAHELDMLNTLSAYNIVLLCHEKIRRRPPRIKKEGYQTLLSHYADEFLRVPSEASKMARVREIVNNLSQF
ncbi:MAG: hypothetical protein OEZ22_06655 [Spirochaetia bacterium]|nr:hypothetical protein [Spirochaetia bacterium]